MREIVVILDNEQTYEDHEILFVSLGDKEERLIGLNRILTLPQFSYRALIGVVTTLNWNQYYMPVTWDNFMHSYAACVHVWPCQIEIRQRRILDGTYKNKKFGNLIPNCTCDLK